jgi:PAS domain S-box-containing protein
VSVAHHFGRPAESGAEAGALFRLVADSLPDGVLVVDGTGRITLANPQAEQQFGYSRGQLLGKSFDLLVPLSDGDGDFLARVAARQSLPGQKLFGRRRDGLQFPVEVRFRRLPTTHAIVVVAVVVDLTEHQPAPDVDRLTLEEQIEFERLVSRLSVSFINLPADRVDDAIREALAGIGESLDFDRCTFYRILPDGMANAPVGWERPGTPAAPAPVSIKERFPWAHATIQSGGVLCFSTADEIPSPIDRAGYLALGVRSSLTVPLSVAGRVVGAVGFNVLREERTWPPEVVHRLSVFANAFGNVLARRDADAALQAAFREAEHLRDQLQAENVYLRSEARERLGTGIIVGQSAAIREILEQVRLVAPTNSTVLLLGETGTGKELVAAEVHELSGRRARAMVRVNCAAIPATLLESELFGREKGAFTGALARQAGRFELADHSTIFLDEIGDLPLDVQVKLLRVLEERQIERLGSPKPIRVDTRIVAATHRNLEQLIAAGKFREDLFYRLNVFPIRLAPLRERIDDIPFLVWRFVEEFSKAFGKPIDSIARENMAALQRYAWPGNIRELRNVVERAMIVAQGPRLTIPLPAPATTVGRQTDRLSDIEKDHIRAVLESTSWRIRGASGAAARLGLRPTTLETRIAKLGLRRPKPSPSG